MVIAIDGPAGAGKSTVARAVAAALGYTYMDSGAMYRCVALAALARADGAAALDSAGGGEGVVAGGGIGAGAVAGASAPPGLLAAIAAGVHIELGARVLLDGRDVTEEIRAPAVSEAASRVAADPGVRDAMVAKQRALLTDGDWVAEGRDIGTVVAPDAAVKVFLTASPAERARRRAHELDADAAVVLAEQTLRDERDSQRAHSPLAAAPGAVLLDTTGLTVAEIVERITALARPASG